MKNRIACSVIALLTHAASGCAADLSPKVAEAIHKGDCSALKSLVNGSNADARGPGGVTALMVSAADNRTECIQLLLDAGADKNATSDEGLTALMYAAHEGHLDSIRMLLSAGVDVNAKTPGGVTALTLAQRKGDLEVLRLLGTVRPPSNTVGNVLVRCDSDCKLSIDGDDLGTLKANQPKKVPLPLGSHIFQATAVQSSKFQDEKTVRITTTDQKIVELELEELIQHAQMEQKRETEQADLKLKRQILRGKEKELQASVVGTYTAVKYPSCSVAVSFDPEKDYYVFRLNGCTSSDYDLFDYYERVIGTPNLDEERVYFRGRAFAGVFDQRGEDRLAIWCSDDHLILRKGQ